MASRSSGSKAWASPRVWLSIAPEISLSVIAAAPFQNQPLAGNFVFATLEPSVAAYHLAFHPSGELYVTGPTTSSYDRVYRITQGGEVIVFYRGLGRPQGIAFDRESNLYVVASFGGRRGIVKITPQGHAEHVLSGSALVGLSLLPPAAPFSLPTAPSLPSIGTFAACPCSADSFLSLWDFVAAAF